MTGDLAPRLFTAYAGLKPFRRVQTVSPASSAPADLHRTFEQMLDAYQNKVFRLAWSMLGNEAAAQDVAQDVFMKIWKALPNYRSDASPSSWIYTITRNTCLSELKKRVLRKNVSLADEAVEAEVDQVCASEPAENTAGQQMDIQVLLAELPEHYRRVITLFYLEQKSYEEVTAALDIPMGTMKTYLHRAKKELMRLSMQRKGSYA
ncbi:MAG: RNA polymerase sigma factor [Verrucomicrobiales bacterium]|nr:RNA polymerase sigma factor [Verrucomicrobiales bacterium]